jgi:hypothetical protein
VNVPVSLAVWVIVPLAAIGPDHGLPFAPPPLAAQPVAPDDDHVRVKLSPIVILEALAVSVLVSACTVNCACVEVGDTALESMLSHVIPNVNCPTCPGPPGV